MLLVKYLPRLSQISDTLSLRHIRDLEQAASLTGGGVGAGLKNVHRTVLTSSGRSAHPM